MSDAAVSFTHVLNPFRAPAGSEHAIASRLTWQTLRTAQRHAAEHGVAVNFRAVILPGDEAAVEPPATPWAQLTRTVQNIAPLKPSRPLPLIADVLRAGAGTASNTHVVFSNMDIAVQPHFYTALHELITSTLGRDVPFTVPRVNIPAALADGPIEAMRAARGTPGLGFDCFVVPRELVGRLDLGNCCLGAAHFDLLLFMALDAVSGGRVSQVESARLTFHLGNDIAWSAMIDYVEHNLAESLAAIARMRRCYPIVPDGAFDKLDRRHFQRNASRASRVLRTLRRLPVLSSVVLHAKRALRRQF